MTPDRAPGTGPTRTDRDGEHWAKPVTRLTVTDVPEGAVGYTVEGRRLIGTVQGFGWLWQKTFRARLEGVVVTPAEVISIWKTHFQEFWPRGNRFFPPLAGLQPGEVALLSISPAAPVKLSTGVMVLYADDESFTFMNPEGHVYAGWITFSAFAEGGATVAQAQLLVRASDPIFEIGQIIGGRIEDRFWQATLRALSQRFGVNANVETQVVCVDRSWQWSKASNIRHNAGIRSMLHLLGAPVRFALGPLRRPRA